MSVSLKVSFHPQVTREDPHADRTKGLATPATRFHLLHQKSWSRVSDLLPNILAAMPGLNAAMSLMAPKVDSQVSRFCWQNLQVDPAPVFPDAELLRDELAQETIYERVFSDDVPLRPPRRYQVRILKELIARIESSIEDWDQHVSGELSGRVRLDLRR